MPEESIPRSFCPVTAEQSLAVLNTGGGNMNPSLRVRKLHRWLGLFFSVSVLMASGSGILHNVMTWTQPAPPPARPSGHELRVDLIKVSTQDALSKLPDPKAKITAVSIREISGEPWYQFLIAEQKPFYVNAVSGKTNPDQDELYAAEIASNYFGGAKAVKAGYLTGYTQEYLNIFRILPVYRFVIEDGRGTRLFVSTMTGSVTRYTDNSKQFEANIFTNIHKLGFIPNKMTRDIVLTALTSGTFILSLLGIILFFMTIPKKTR